MMPVFLRISETSEESDFCSTTTQRNGGGTNLSVFDSLLRFTSLSLSFILVGVTRIISLLGIKPSSFSSSFSSSFDEFSPSDSSSFLLNVPLSSVLSSSNSSPVCAGENADRFEGKTGGGLVEKIEDLPVGANPVKNPMTKHNKKWTMAFLYNSTFFFDLSAVPISIPRTNTGIRMEKTRARMVGMAGESKVSSGNLYLKAGKNSTKALFLFLFFFFLFFWVLVYGGS